MMDSNMYLELLGKLVIIYQDSIGWGDDKTTYSLGKLISEENKKYNDILIRFGDNMEDIVELPTDDVI